MLDGFIFLGRGADSNEFNVLLESQFKFQVGDFVGCGDELLERTFVFIDPGEGFFGLTAGQRGSDLVARDKDVQVDQVGDLLGLGESQCGFGMTRSEEIVDDKAVEACPCPLLILDIGQRRDIIQVLKMFDAFRRMLV